VDLQNKVTAINITNMYQVTYLWLIPCSTRQFTAKSPVLN